MKRYDTSSPPRWIASHTMRYWWLPVMLIATSIVNNAAYGTIPLYIGRGFDVIREPGWRRNDLLVIAAVVALAAVFQGVTGLLRNIATELLAQRVERDSREELYTSLLGKSQSFHAAQRVGDIMARATNDVRALNMMFSPGIMLIIDSALALLVPFAMILLIDPGLWIVPTLFTVLLAVTVWDYNRRLAPVSIAQREQFGVVNSHLAEAIGGIEVVKGNVRERSETETFFDNARSFRHYFVRQGEIQARYWPMMAFAASWGLGLFHSLWLWRNGALSLGEVVGFMGLFGTFRFATFISLFSFNLVQIGLASSARILELIVQETTLDQNIAGHSRRIVGDIELKRVGFSFDGTADGFDLDDISFNIQSGETIAIVGRTGAGKTTLTRLINRIFDVTRGSVLVDGVDVRDWNLESLRSQISAIEQDIFLYSMTIRENIAFGRPTATEGEIVEAAKLAQADDFIRGFRDGYETEIGERGVTLSGGQKQRLAIARAFLTDPRILILDDSTSAIDSRTEDEIQQAMQRIAADRTTLIITHRLSQIRRADRVLLLRRGRVLETGNHDELMTRCDDYRRLFSYM
ncbi:MAG: ABC transporter ATP-binding protein/permease [Spirochaetales bacterium]|nr:ABC transporter ATP-binding protein/permease [Spirochaetales bacterium]